MNINAHLVCGVCRWSKTPRGCVTPGRAGFKAWPYLGHGLAAVARLFNFRSVYWSHTFSS